MQFSCIFDCNVFRSIFNFDWFRICPLSDKNVAGSMLSLYNEGCNVFRLIFNFDWFSNTSLFNRSSSGMIKQSDCMENCIYCVGVNVSVMYKTEFDLSIIIECIGLCTELIGLEWMPRMSCRIWMDWMPKMSCRIWIWNSPLSDKNLMRSQLGAGSMLSFI